MSVSAFFTEESKRLTTDVVARVERGTGAEIVVAMRHRVAPRAPAMAIAALVFGLAAFLVAWFSPVAYATKLMPLDAALGALLGALAARRFATLARLLTPRSIRREAARRAARAAFVQFGVERTRDRTGILILAAVEDHEVAIVSDEGVPERVVAADLERASLALTLALRAKSFADFVAALDAMAAPLAAALPRRADDTNELCDAPV